MLSIGICKKQELKRWLASASGPEAQRLTATLWRSTKWVAVALVVCVCAVSFDVYLIFSPMFLHPFYIDGSLGNRLFGWGSLFAFLLYIPIIGITVLLCQ